MQISNDVLSARPDVKVIEPGEVGFGGLGVDDFTKLIIEELKNQDPLEPASSDALLNQLSTMRGLQSSMDLNRILENLANNQTLSSASNLINKFVTGTFTDPTGSVSDVAGVANRAFSRDGELYVGVGQHQEMLLKNVTEVTEPSEIGKFLVGKYVDGAAGSKSDAIRGVVEDWFTQDGNVTLRLQGGGEIPLSDVTTWVDPSASAA
jgi:flagellar basal-body rod modification protein FlgD